MAQNVAVLRKKKKGRLEDEVIEGWNGQVQERWIGWCKVGWTRTFLPMMTAGTHS